MSKRKLGKKIVRSKFFQKSASRIIHSLLQFIYASNRIDDESKKHFSIYSDARPAIYTLWHGQHFLAPYTCPKSERQFHSLMVSKSADAQINADAAALAGFHIIRGSGGRSGKTSIEKGGVSATLGLVRALRKGRSVVMIADISKGVPRKSGRGIVSLAKLSGYPIIPIALATSRFKVFEKSWDKTTLNLPFGRSSFRAGNAIYIPADCSEEELDKMRLELDDELNRITHEVYKAVGHPL